ncbi:gamma-glutamyl transpeptidase [Tribonema minus]|uniref:Gamma-glutamyl transpeptidase n=1 Tax=Tribonema minus TaxID=303371 RepID=A0A835Z955_9STRA|nr:gamma-glutamyl transpeptidase [Tribonema minus]
MKRASSFDDAVRRTYVLRGPVEARICRDSHGAAFKRSYVGTFSEIFGVSVRLSPLVWRRRQRVWHAAVAPYGYQVGIFVMARARLAFTARRSPVLGTKGAVASSQSLATHIGARILKRGGNAVDAAVAVAAALAVTEPCSCGLGGDCFMLFYDSSSKIVKGLNGSGRCPAELTLNRAMAETGRGPSETLPNRHPHTVTVPGAAAAWDDAVSKWGSGVLTLSQILDPAARLAEEGFPVGPVTAYHWNEGLAALDGSAGGGELRAPGERRAPRCGEVFRNPGMACTLRELGEGGQHAFYGGRVGRAIVEVLALAGGVLSMDDLAMHESTFPEPISVDYKGVRVFEVPPNGQGITALLALNILAELEQQHTRSPKLHALIWRAQALRLAFSDTRYYCADPDVVDVPVVQLLSREYARELSKLFDPQSACRQLQHGHPAAQSCTVSFQVVDDAGNAVSMVVSNYEGFGTGLVPTGCGFTLQNRGLNFSLDAAHPNCLAPSAHPLPFSLMSNRPYHTIIPCMATVAATGELYATLTNMGRFMQPQGHLQLLCHLLRGVDPQTAVDMPRFCITDIDGGRRVDIEDGTPDEVVESLRRRGHDVRVLSGHSRAQFGRAQIILRDGTSGVLWCGSDGRADGMAIAF